MHLATSPQAAVAHALQRSVMYRFLSVALRPPAEGLAEMDETQWAAVADAAGAGGEEAVAAVRAARQGCADVSPRALVDEFDRTFGHQVGTDCPPYEAQYTAGGIFSQTQCLADVAGFYQAFGLDVDDRVRERPDHICLELEFMHVLAYREAYARAVHGPREVALLTEAQQAFLREHLGCWGTAFSRLVGRKTDGPYRALAAAVAAWVAADAAALGVDLAGDPGLVPSADAPAPGEDAFACGAGRCPLDSQP